MFCIVPNVSICLHCQNKTTTIKTILNIKKIIEMKNSNTPTQVLNNKPINTSNNETKNAASKSNAEKNVFSSADLWHIQKMSRTSFARRRVNTMM
jgi:hypothetical protein